MIFEVEDEFGMDDDDEEEEDEEDEDDEDGDGEDVDEIGNVDEEYFCEEC